jgi:hypothetical protein
VDINDPSEKSNRHGVSGRPAMSSHQLDESNLSKRGNCFFRGAGDNLTNQIRGAGW